MNIPLLVNQKIPRILLLNNSLSYFRYCYFPKKKFLAIFKLIEYVGYEIKKPPIGGVLTVF